MASNVHSMIQALRNRPYFFDEGICFECLRCGSCCTGEPGFVFVEEEEMDAIADFLLISRQVFMERCLYPVGERFSIRETEDFRCIFYENGCAIYPVRPLQCRTFPFWAQNLRSPRAWDETRLRCPGIGKGYRYSKSEILDIVACSVHLFSDLPGMSFHEGNE
ncbi:MAG: YkgJ family cysteine cluster protein [Desulfomonilia bacterium]